MEQQPPSLLSQQMASIKADHEMEEKEFEDKLEKAEFRFHLEKVHKEKALERCENLEKMLEAERKGKNALQKYLFNLEEQHQAAKAKIAGLEEKLADRQMGGDILEMIQQKATENETHGKKESSESKIEKRDADIQQVPEVADNNTGTKDAASAVTLEDKKSWATLTSAKVNSDILPIDDDVSDVTEESSSTSQSEAINSLNGVSNHLVVVKKLFYMKDGNKWEAYLTLDDEEQPTILCLKDSNLFINGKIVSKKLVLDGDFYQLSNDLYKIHKYEDYRKLVSNLLENYVHSCKLSKILLDKQKISWMEYEKLISAGKVKNLYFAHVCVEKEDGTVASIEDVMEKLPNIEKFACDMGYHGSIELTKETFMKLPTFKCLQKLCLYGITLDPFDADSFLGFMKKHPNAHITLSFRYAAFSEKEKTKIKAIATKLRKADSSHDKLKIELTTNENKINM